MHTYCGLQKQIAVAFLVLIDFPGIFCHNNRRCPLFFFLFKFSERNNGRSTIYLMLSLADDSDVRCSAAHYCAHGWLLEHIGEQREKGMTRRRLKRHCFHPPLFVWGNYMMQVRIYLHHPRKRVVSLFTLCIQFPDLICIISHIFS
jgi:hypothetical protein